jgi:short-subunit dehydrogenase
MNDLRPICFITGVGPGTGRAIARTFDAVGYRVALNARNASRLNDFAKEFKQPILLPGDLADPAVRQNVAADLLSFGVPSVVVNNAVGGKFGTYIDIEPSDLTRNFAINVEAVLDLARSLIPKMIEKGGGTFLATGNTSAYSGKPNFAAFAPTKAAQRILLESIARTVGRDGIHVGYVAIDAVIDLAWTRQMVPDKDDDYFCTPDDIAQEVLRIAQQPRSAWSFDSVIRPFGETW